MTRLLPFDAGWTTTEEAEHAAHELVRAAGLPVVSACTHFATDPSRVLVTVDVGDGMAPAAPIGMASTSAPAQRAVESHRLRRSGRAFVFPGMQGLPAQTTVAEVIARTAIETVVVLGGGDADPATPMSGLEFVRPEYVDGSLVLRAMPGPGGTFLPFEQPPGTGLCCGGH